MQPLPVQLISTSGHNIRGAAIQAVLDGTEKITRTTLDSIGVDIASETTDTGRRRPRNRP